MVESSYIGLGQLKPKPKPAARKYSGKPVRVRESKNPPRQAKGEVKKETPRAKRGYRIRYGTMPAKSLPTIKLIPFHPGYGNPIGEHGSKTIVPTSHRYNMLNRENGFYDKLRASLEEKGCINPIHALSIEEGTYCIYGSSRLWIAQDLDIEVKVIITDYINRWDELEELYTREDVLAKFQDPPETLVMEDDRMRMYGCAHIHVGP